MAAKEIIRRGTTDLPREFSGTNAERLALVNTGFVNGTKFEDTDTGITYTFNGTSWIFDSLPTNVPTKNISVEIIRTGSGDVTAYTAGDLVNIAAATDLPKIAFGSEFANKTVQLTGVSITTDYQTDFTKLKNFKIYFFNASTTIVADNAAFVPTYDDYIAKRAGQPITVSDVGDMTAATGLAFRIATEICRKITLNASGDLYFAPAIDEALTPVSGQKFTFAFHFYVL